MLRQQFRNDAMRQIIVPMVRINDSYTTPDMAADLMEHDIKKLNLLYQRGGESFGKHEEELTKLLL